MTAPLTPPVVVIADDDDNDVFLFKRAFQRLNKVATLLVLDDGQDVVSYLRGMGNYADRVLWPLPRVLIMDQGMPGLSGCDALVWLRTHSEFKKLPVVILTGGLSPVHQESLRILRAACCLKRSGFDEMSLSLNRAICTALRLVSETWLEPCSAKRQVLIVDDDPIVLESLGALLRHVGHEVQTARSGADALQELEEREFDLVMTDLIMPQMMGEELAEKIKRRRPHLPVIFTSGNHWPETLAQPSCFLAKPFSLRELRQAIARCVPGCVSQLEKHDAEENCA